MRCLFALILALLLLVIPAVTGAQDNQLVWDLDGVYAVSDLHFQFPYPKDWIVHSSNSTRIVKIQSPSDGGTNEQGFTISLDTLHVDVLDVPAEATLDNVVDKLAGNITENEGRMDTSVLAHRAVTVSNTDKSSLSTIWMLDNYIVILTLEGPTLDSAVQFTWDNLLSGITPIDSATLTEKPLSFGDFTLRLPEGWIFDGNRMFYELKTDMDNKTPDPQGITILFAGGSFSDFGENVKDFDSLVDTLKQERGWAEDRSSLTTEGIILDQPAVMMSGVNSAHGWAEIIVFPHNDQVVSIFMSYPSEARFREFRPTVFAILQSITATEPAAS